MQGNNLINIARFLLNHYLVWVSHEVSVCCECRSRLEVLNCWRPRQRCRWWYYGDAMIQTRATRRCTECVCVISDCVHETRKNKVLGSCVCEKMRNEKTALHSLHSLNRNTQVKCDKTCDKIIILFIFWEWRLLVEYYARIESINSILFPAIHGCCM